MFLINIVLWLATAFVIVLVLSFVWERSGSYGPEDQYRIALHVWRYEKYHGLTRKPPPLPPRYDANRPKPYRHPFTKP